MTTKLKHYKQMLNYWDSQAKTFTIFKNKLQITNKILRVIQKRNCENILEIGCGLAEDTLVIAQRNKRKITCIDFSPEMIKKAKKRIEEKGLIRRVSFILGNILEIKLKEDFFDGIIAKSVLHHLFSKDDIISVCKKMHKSLKAKGIFILVENWTNPESSEYENLVFQISQKTREFKGIIELFPKKDEYLRILKRIGFRNVKWVFIDENINIDRYTLNKTLKVEVRKIKLAFPKGKVKTLFIVAYK